MNIENIVNRFLSWELPEDFYPDAGISFDRDSGHEPTGTNLFDYGQAEEMVRYILADELTEEQEMSKMNIDRNENLTEYMVELFRRQQRNAGLYGS